MVKKLFKYEIAAYLRVWLPIQLLVIAVSLFGRMIQVFESENILYMILIFCIIGTYCLCISASIVFNIIYSFIRYYKNLFTNEGYLTFTLPISASQHIFVKLATSVMFGIASLIMVFVSFCIISAGDFFVESMRAIGYYINLAIDKVGIHFVLYVIEALILLVVYIAASRMLYNTCITIGQKANKGRIGFAILAYFIFNVICQSVITIAQFVFLLIPMETMDAFGKYLAKNCIPVIHIGALGLIVILSTVTIMFFLICRKIIINKLNLQ